MPLRSPYYSDYSNPNESQSSDQQYLMSSGTRGRNGHPNDSGFYSGDMVPLRHMANSTDVTITPSKKRIGTLDLTNPMENETLIDPGPVKLAPCWESKHAPSEELNLKNHSPKSDFEGNPPKDRLNLVFLIFVLHGVGVLMPWNMFITAKSYFVDYKLQSNGSHNSTIYQNHFLSYMGVASQVPNVLCNALSVFVKFSGGTFTFRIIGSILIEIIIFIITVLLAILDSSSWQGIFFYVTMASVVVINMANGIYQNSIYGLAAKLPRKFSMAIVLGNNLSGTMTTLILIASIAVSPNQRTAAIYYFISALFVLLACVDTYFALPLIRYYRYYDRLTEKAILSSRHANRRPPFFQIFKKTSLQCFNVFCVFFVTLSIFPALHADIKPVDPDFIIQDVYFTPVTCFLCVNFFAMVGSFVPKWIKWPGPKYLCIPVLLRFFMIPFFMLCNYKPDSRALPVIITNDWAYTGMSAAMGFTSGYYSSLAMMYAPGCVETEHAPVAGMMAALFLVLGILCGVNFTFLLSWLVEINLF